MDSSPASTARRVGDARHDVDGGRRRRTVVEHASTSDSTGWAMSPSSAAGTWCMLAVTSDRGGGGPARHRPREAAPAAGTRDRPGPGRSPSDDDLRFNSVSQSFTVAATPSLGWPRTRPSARRPRCDCCPPRSTAPGRTTWPAACSAALARYLDLDPITTSKPPTPTAPPGRCRPGPVPPGRRSPWRKCAGDHRGMTTRPAPDRSEPALARRWPGRRPSPERTGRRVWLRVAAAQLAVTRSPGPDTSTGTNAGSMARSVVDHTRIDQRAYGRSS